MNATLSKRSFSLIGKKTVIVAGKRTCVGSFMGSLSNLTATQLGAIAARGAISQAGIETKDIEEMFIGNINAAGVG